jgi:hypothetical protein
LSPGSAPAPSPQSPPPPPSNTNTWAADRAAEQRSKHTPPPTSRQSQAPGPNAPRPPDWDRSAGAEYVRAADARRAASGNDQQPAPPVTPDRRAGDPPKYKIGEDLELSEEDVRGLMTRHALEESRKATVPTAAADYKLELPKDFQVPQGIEFRWATEDPVLGPMIGQAKEFAHKAGL